MCIFQKLFQLSVVSPEFLGHGCLFGARYAEMCTRKIILKINSVFGRNFECCGVGFHMEFQVITSWELLDFLTIIFLC